jgi:hypothetical protein
VCVRDNGFISVTRRREGKGRMEISQQLARISWVESTNEIIVSLGLANN